MGVVSQKLRASARGQECTLRIPGVCNHDRDTTVLAHIRTKGASGMAQKPDDWHAVFACSDCHDVLDKRKHVDFVLIPYLYVIEALQRTQKIWFDMGLITIPGQIHKPEPKSSKMLPPLALYRDNKIGE